MPWKIPNSKRAIILNDIEDLKKWDSAVGEAMPTFKEHGVTSSRASKVPANPSQALTIFHLSDMDKFDAYTKTAAFRSWLQQAGGNGAPQIILCEETYKPRPNLDRYLRNETAPGVQTALWKMRRIVCQGHQLSDVGLEPKHARKAIKSRIVPADLYDQVLKIALEDERSYLSD